MAEFAPTRTEIFKLLLMETTRSEALAAGDKRYFTGHPCSSGHVWFRETSSTTCRACLIVRRPPPNPRVKLSGSWYSRNKERVKANWKPLTREQRDRENARAVAKYHADPERAREKNRAKFAKNRERNNTFSREYARRNRERMKETNKAWRAANPHKNAEYLQKRRWRKEAGRNDLTAAEIRELVAIQKGRCANCGRKPERLTVDHIIPLVKGGENTRRNIQMLCKTCNCQKQALHPVDFARRQGRLL